MSISRPRRGAALAAAITALALLLTGCSRVDAVTVTAAGTSVALPAALTCFAPSGSTELSCAGGESDDGAPHLTLAAGTAVDVAVPESVGDTPWVIVFSSIGPDGTARDDRTAVFPPKDRYSYRLDPGPAVQLTRLEVQSLTAAPAAGGGLEFPATNTWVLIIDPAGERP